MAETEAINNETEAKSEQVRSVHLRRLPKSGQLAGVCAGLAEYLQMDVTLLRIIFVVLTLASGGFGLLVYLVLAIIMPSDDAEVGTHPLGQDFGKNLNGIASDIKDNGGLGRLRNYLGAVLILFGAWLLLSQFFPGILRYGWEVIWPAVLILIGLFILTRGRR